MRVPLQLHERPELGATLHWAGKGRVPLLEGSTLGPVVEGQVLAHLTAPRPFRMGQSALLDDFKVFTAAPTDRRDLFEYALSDLVGATGVRVLWDKVER